MGLLSLGTPLPWAEAKQYSDHVRQNGIVQFLNIWNRVKSRRRDKLYWGDEIEYMVVHFDHDAQKVRLSLRASDVLERLQALEADALARGEAPEASWKPEFARYMLEATPGLPYGSHLDELAQIEANMRRRRQLGQAHLRPGEVLMSLTNFPMLGTDDFLRAAFEPLRPTPAAGIFQSFFVPDDAITGHARFPTLAKNIRERRTGKVAINVPIFHDTHTPRPWREPCPPSLAALDAARRAQALHTPLCELLPDALEDHIYMDAMCFGMGCSCLQVTFQACRIEEARKLYDHLAVLTPVFLALSAGTPVFRGHLADVDCRWNVISASVDDRTPCERGARHNADRRCDAAVGSGTRFKIAKSRYDSIDSYLGPGHPTDGSETPGCTELGSHYETDYYRDAYNDIELTYDPEIYQRLRDASVDELLAKHYAHLFIRDPLVVFRELLDQDNVKSSDHFENIQSTNWQTMRFKPPPATSSDIGWRVEFRSMEIQLTDFENAAFAVFLVLVTRMIVSFNVNLYLPLSQVDENLARAQRRDAVRQETFWFRRHILPKDGNTREHFAEMGIDEIINGTRAAQARKSRPESPHGTPSSLRPPTTATTDDEADVFPGLVPLVHTFLDAAQQVTPSTRRTLDRYLRFVSARAAGRLPTNAMWIRQQLLRHPDYRHDSVVTPTMAYDLCRAIHDQVEAGVDTLGGDVPELEPLVAQRIPGLQLRHPSPQP
ncbi:hypothetical protein CXG81DRAFT_11207 [Caulochytrium protostelioides]|uniref:Glutamate--cysteine ligase n=1 Tax=Caulochytrium protostelioides TaxID=1555241 RepID=A0A4P9XAG8_9FUNG|nr:hypothetical protein CXG81DRAFT_11207 [Caulochytrium protostelioides]|eukprot:RKP02081.1 hypothetical protein CXG81DRAFT_11207 [Caulochytrium protostelioides]